MPGVLSGDCQFEHLAAAVQRKTGVVWMPARPILDLFADRARGGPGAPPSHYLDPQLPGRALVIALGAAGVLGADVALGIGHAWQILGNDGPHALGGERIG